MPKGFPTSSKSLSDRHPLGCTARAPSRSKHANKQYNVHLRALALGGTAIRRGIRRLLGRRLATALELEPMATRRAPSCVTLSCFTGARPWAATARALPPRRGRLRGSGPGVGRGGPGPGPRVPMGPGKKMRVSSPQACRQSQTQVVSKCIKNSQTLPAGSQITYDRLAK